MERMAGEREFGNGNLKLDPHLPVTGRCGFQLKIWRGHNPRALNQMVVPPHPPFRLLALTSFLLLLLRDSTSEGVLPSNNSIRLLQERRIPL